jgi:hypothetical protein
MLRVLISLTMCCVVRSSPHASDQKVSPIIQRAQSEYLSVDWTSPRGNGLISKDIDILKRACVVAKPSSLQRASTAFMLARYGKHPDAWVGVLCGVSTTNGHKPSPDADTWQCLPMAIAKVYLERHCKTALKALMDVSVDGGPAEYAGDIVCELMLQKPYEVEPFFNGRIHTRNASKFTWWAIHATDHAFRQTGYPLCSTGSLAID